MKCEAILVSLGSKYLLTPTSPDMTEIVIKKTDLYIIKENNRTNRKIKTKEIRKKIIFTEINWRGNTKRKRSLAYKKRKRKEERHEELEKSNSNGVELIDAGSSTGRCGGNSV